ncbi:MAG: rhodanese-like domain-containing protein [Geminicoccaceae bacterium]
MTSRRVFVCGALLAALFGSGPARAVDAGRWIVSPAEAADLVRSGALVLDARASPLAFVDRPAGALPVAWQDFTEPDFPNIGRLIADDAELSRRLQALGVRPNVPVLVLGDPIDGWGEEGRVTWMLRTLGHDGAVAVDSGLPALRDYGLPAIRPATLPGDFVVHRRPDLDIDREALRSELNQPDLVLLDAREPAEFAGATPHGEGRGGHIPGAKNLWYRDLQGPDGRLLPADVLKAKLAALGIAPGTEVVAYCSAGVRAGWVTTVLNDLGYRARNFAGSMWDWSAGDPARFPLQSGD